MNSGFHRLCLWFRPSMHPSLPHIHSSSPIHSCFINIFIVHIHLELQSVKAVEMYASKHMNAIALFIVLQGYHENNEKL